MNLLIYNYLKKRWHEAASHNNKILASYIESKEHAKILDLGVDSGLMILDRVKNIKKPEVYGIDISQEAVTSARKLGIIARRWNVEKGLPYHNSFFDIVSANQIIEHLVNIDLFVQEIHRVLKPGGYLVLSTENLSSWHNIFAVILGWQAFSQHISMKRNIGNPMRMARMEGYDSHGRHLIIFTLRGLKELMELYNLRIVKFFGAGYYPFPEPLSRWLAKIDPVHAAFIGLKAVKKR